MASDLPHSHKRKAGLFLQGAASHFEDVDETLHVELENDRRPPHLRSLELPHDRKSSLVVCLFFEGKESSQKEDQKQEL
jgi:hypothetical protein